MPELDAADTEFICDRCGYSAVLTANGYAHASQADAAMCQILAWADRGCGPDA